MGCSPFRVSDDLEYEPNTITSPNPNKYNFTITDTIDQVGDLVFIRVHYPDCTTFDGMKLIILETTNYNHHMDVLDPHFLEDNNVLARFKPTTRGWEMAKTIMNQARKDLDFWDSIYNELRK